MEEKLYTDCDRCGMPLQIMGVGAIEVANYKNATLCLRCAKIRNFDDENPIMYPISNK